MAKNDLILNIGFKIDKSSIDTKTLTDTIAKQLRNVSIDKIKVSKSAINAAFKDITLTLNKIKISQSALTRLKTQLQKELSSIKLNVTAGQGQKSPTQVGTQPAGSPGDALIKGRDLANARSFKSLVEEIATRSTPSALRAQQRYNRAVGQGGVSFKELGARVSAITQRFAEYAIAIRAVGVAQNLVGAGFAGVFDFDKAIQDLSKVQRAAGNIGAAFGALTSTALKTGRSIEEVSTSINEFVRQGKSLAEAARFSEEALKLSNISTLSAADSARLATAAQQVFGITAGELSQKLGTIAVFADQSATSVTEVGTAFLRSASSAEAAGVSFEELTGLLAGTLEQTRLGASTVGTAFKTLFARTQKFRKEIVELNNGFANAVGAQDAVINSSDSVLDIFTKIAKIFPLLNAQQKNQVANQVAGVRQTNVFIGAINNLQKAQSLYNTEVDGSAALNAKNEAELAKLSVRATNLTTSFKALSASLAGISTGGQDGAAGFAGELIDSLTGTISTLTGITTALDSVEVGFINLGGVVKSALVGGIVGLITLLKGPLIAGARDFFQTSTKGAQNLTQNLIEQQKVFLRGQALQKKNKNNNNLAVNSAVQKSLSRRIQLEGSINNQLSARAQLLSAEIAGDQKLILGLKNRIKLEQQRADILINLEAQTSKVRAGAKGGLSTGGRTAALFAGADVLGSVFAKLGTTIIKTDTFLGKLGADTSNFAGSFVKNGALLGSLFGKTGVATAFLTGSLEFAAKRIGDAFAKAESAIKDNFIANTLDKINTVPIVQGLNQASQGLSNLSIEISKDIIADKRRVDIIEKVNQASEDYLKTLRQQDLESTGLSSTFASAVSELEKGIGKLGRIEQDGFSPDGRGINIGQKRDFNTSSNPFVQAEALNGIAEGDAPFKIQTAQTSKLKEAISESNVELARLQALADEAIEPLTKLAKDMKEIANNSKNAEDATKNLRDKIGSFKQGFDKLGQKDNFLGIPIGKSDLFKGIGLLQDLAQDLLTSEESAIDVAGRLSEEAEKRVKELQKAAGVSLKINEVATKTQELGARLTEEDKKQAKLLNDSLSAYRLIQEQLKGIEKTTEIAANSQKRIFEETKKELEFRNQIQSIESQRIRSADEIIAREIQIRKLKGETNNKPINILEIEKGLLQEKLNRELQINVAKRQRELLNSKEIKNAKELVKAAELLNDSERVVAAESSLAQLQGTARTQGEALGRQDTDRTAVIERAALIESQINKAFEGIAKISEESSRRVTSSEKDRVEAAEKVLASNQAIISAEQGLASARAELASANSDIVTALREAADAQARYAVDVSNAQRAALESTGVQLSLANAFDFAASNIDQVTNQLNRTIASEQLLSQIRAQSAAELLQKVTQLASSISGFAVSFFTASDQQRNQLQQAQQIAQGVASGDISAAAVPEELRSAVAGFTDIIPGLREQLEGFGSEQTGLAGQLEQLRQVSLQLATDSVSKEQLTATQDSLAATQSAAAQAEEGVRTAKDQLSVANLQKQIALNNLAEATATRNVAVADASTLKFYTDRALDKLQGIEDKTRDFNVSIKSVGRDIVSALRSISFSGREAIGGAAGGTLSGAEINGLVGAARKEKRLMPAGSKLMLANTSETVLTRRQSNSLGFKPRSQKFAANGNADTTALNTLMESLVGEIRGLRADVATGGVQSVQLNVDTQRNINLRGVEGLSQRLERELAGKFASGGEMEAISGLILDIITRMNEVGLSDALGR